MYGPYDSTDPNKAHALNALVCKFIRAARSGQPVSVWGTGVAIREWLYAPDFGRIVLEILRQGGEVVGLAEPLNIAQNFGLSVRELVGLISKMFSNEIEIRWETERPDGAPRKVMDDSRFRRIFPQFTFTKLSEGLEETLRYYSQAV
jgi:GDP-L-fucose synthase